MNSTGSRKNNTAQGTALWNRIMIIGLTVILSLSIIYYFIARDSLSKENYTESYSGVETIATIGELTDGSEVYQSFIPHSDFLNSITVRFANYGNEATGNIRMELRDSREEKLAQIDLDAATLVDNGDMDFVFDQAIPVETGEPLTLYIYSTGGSHQSSVTMWAGLEQQDCTLIINGNKWPNTLYIIPNGYKVYNYSQNHWLFTAVLMVLYGAFCFYQKWRMLNGVRTGFNEIIHIFDEYTFLLKRLVTGEFINKYRRSYLGVVWSLLNPLLMMIIMSIVFSSVFRFTSMPNFQVYLILGQVMFSFFSESTQVSIMTIVGAGQLIKKAYLPKYIFPLSKVVFSFLNTTISFVAVLLVMVFYRVPITINCLYFPLIMGTFFLFCLGIGLILSSLMVFIRDTLHLYTVLLTALGYLTPIFYSIEMLPPALQRILKCNPLYHFITAMRTILLYGKPLNLNEVFLLIGMAALSMIIGIQYFHSKQNRFILFI